MGNELGLIFFLLGVAMLYYCLLYTPKNKIYFQLLFTINSIIFKIKGGRMTVEISSKQKFEFDVLFKNKNGNPARVDGTVKCSFVDPNTGEPVTTTATATASPVDANDQGDSSTHHVVVETTEEEIAAVTMANLRATADVDLDNDADDSTDEDIKSVDFDLLTVVLKPLEASQVGIENLTPVEDLP